jgi:NADH-quinone oxidoreductase subunit H
MVTVSALCATLFFGGWHAPWPITLWSGAAHGVFPFIWFTAKVLILLFVFVWLRGTMPRLRYDQFMRFGWKVLIPISLVWILVVAGVRVLQSSDISRARTLTIVAIVLVALILLLSPWLFGKPPEDPVKPGDVEPQEGGFPTPPMDLSVPPSPRLRRVAGERATVPIPAGDVVTVPLDDGEPDGRDNDSHESEV